MEEVQLTKKEKRELAKQKKKEERRKVEMGKKVRNGALWLIVLGIVGFLGFRIYQFFTEPLPQQAVTPIEVVDSDHTLGSPESQAVLIEYADFQCPACKAYSPLVKKLSEDYPNDLLIVYRHFPLTQIHANAKLAAFASEAAANQEKFWEMTELLYERQDDWKDSGDAQNLFLEYAEELDLDTEKFSQDLDSSEIEEKVNADMLSGNSLGVNATPTFYLNGRKLNNIRSYEDFRTEIDSVLNN